MRWLAPLWQALHPLTASRPLGRRGEDAAALHPQSSAM